MLKLPRVLVTRFVRGMAVGAPNDTAQQLDVLGAALRLLEAPSPEVGWGSIARPRTDCTPRRPDLDGMNGIDGIDRPVHPVQESSPAHGIQVPCPGCGAAVTAGFFSPG